MRAQVFGLAPSDQSKSSPHFPIREDSQGQLEPRIRRSVEEIILKNCTMCKYIFSL